MKTCGKFCTQDCEGCWRRQERRSLLKLIIGLLIVFTVIIPIIPFIISLILQEM